VRNGLCWRELSIAAIRLGFGVRLQDVASGARLQHIARELFGVVHRQHEDFAAR